MTQAPNYNHPPAQFFEDEIDLREYILVLIKYWRWIVGVSVLAAIVAFGVSSFLPRTYEASANVLILKSETQISFEPKFQTTTDEQLGDKNYQNTLADLVKSNDLAAIVLAQSSELFSSGEQTVLDLLKMVDVSTSGDVVSINITSQDPEVAAQLANIWATAYVDYVNTLLGEGKNSLLIEIEKQVQGVTDDYQSAQLAWEKFLGDNQITTLSLEIDAKKSQLQTLRNQQSDIEKNPLFLQDLEQKTQRQLLSNKYAELKQLDVWMSDALAMRDQIGQGATSEAATAGDALAFVLLRSQVLASSAKAGVQLQLNLADIAESDVSAIDVFALIETLQNRQTRVQDEIDNLSNVLISTQEDVVLDVKPIVSSEAMTALNAEILSLTAELEKQQAQQRELKQTRDLAWENYTTIQRKMAEVKLDSQITDSQVRVASQAIVPEEAISPRRMMNTAIAGVLGLMLSIFGVFAIDFWQKGGLSDLDETTEQKG